MRGILERLSHELESRLAPKTPWKIDKVEANALAKMTRQIVPIAMQINDIQSTWKLSQNKPDQARMGVIKGLETSAIGAETNRIKRLIERAESDGAS